MPSQTPPPSPNGGPGPARSPLIPALVTGLLLVGGFAFWRARPTSTPAGQTAQTASAPSVAAPNAQTRSSTAQDASQPDGRLHVFVAADVSRSVNKSLRQNATDGLKFALRQALPGGTPLHFIFYDREARTRPGVVEFYEPRDLDDVSSAFLRYTPRPEQGTRQSLALARLMDEARALPPGTPVAFALITDGEDHDAPATRRLATRIAAMPGFRGLLVVGAQMESRNRAYLRDQLNASLAPLQGRKVICGEEVSDREADELRELLAS